jgi:hypothetical protein
MGDSGIGAACFGVLGQGWRCMLFVIAFLVAGAWGHFAQHYMGVKLVLHVLQHMCGTSSTNRFF